MISDLEVAQVLEDAATLYEDEKIEWCDGYWVKLTDRGEVTTLSMCAEGKDSGAYVRYVTARDLVNQKVGGVGVACWNDDMADREQGGKQAVIETFREAAKDLRNRAPAEEL